MDDEGKILIRREIQTKKKSEHYSSEYQHECIQNKLQTYNTAD